MLQQNAEALTRANKNPFSSAAGAATPLKLSDIGHVGACALSHSRGADACLGLKPSAQRAADHHMHVE